MHIYKHWPEEKAQQTYGWFKLAPATGHAHHDRRKAPSSSGQGEKQAFVSCFFKNVEVRTTQRDNRVPAHPCKPDGGKHCRPPAQQEKGTREVPKPTSRPTPRTSPERHLPPPSTHQNMTTRREERGSRTTQPPAQSGRKLSRQERLSTCVPNPE